MNDQQPEGESHERKARGYTQEDLLEGVTIAGASFIHEKLKVGAASLSF